MVGDDVIARAVADEVDGVAGSEQVVNEIIAGAGRADSGDGIASNRVRYDHPARAAGMNAGAVVVAGVVGDDVIAATSNINAGNVVVASIVGDVGPGGGNQDSPPIVMAVVIEKGRLGGILNVDAHGTG